MADTSTPNLSQKKTSRIHLRVSHRGERRVMPSRLTIEFIRQFAQVYHVSSILPDDFNGVVLN